MIANGRKATETKVSENYHLGFRDGVELGRNDALYDILEDIQYRIKELHKYSNKEEEDYGDK